MNRNLQIYVSLTKRNVPQLKGHFFLIASHVNKYEVIYIYIYIYTFFFPFVGLSNYTSNPLKLILQGKSPKRRQFYSSSFKEED